MQTVELQLKKYSRTISKNEYLLPPGEILTKTPHVRAHTDNIQVTHSDK